MKILIDTHIFLWYVTNNQKLNESTKLIINDRGNIIYISQASIWEIAIKNSVGKLTFNSSFREFIEEQIRVNDFNILTFNLSNFEQITKLPFHHRNPFDRIIIAQSIIEKIPIISYDEMFKFYDIQLLD
ncbi:type II toxin-antitoxin system VapC family toxin [Geminocystis herdmanii]|uniref:type II toxin-antitoxin system VapC family toxin n=1 Tax=Geminocystis herdmanii TaxID=669359 RepID=UPI000348C26E|nr:type II toxin-antitoxin system VapC family toxin [Geminocystis herdmanii]